MGAGAAGLPSRAQILWPGGGGSWSPGPRPASPAAPGNNVRGARPQLPMGILLGRLPLLLAAGSLPALWGSGAPIVQVDTVRPEGLVVAVQQVPGLAACGQYLGSLALVRGPSDRVRPAPSETSRSDTTVRTKPPGGLWRSQGAGPPAGGCLLQFVSSLGRGG